MKLQLEPEQRASLLEAREALYQARLEGREALEVPDPQGITSTVFSASTWN